MKAVALPRYLPIDVDLPKPQPAGRDLPVAAKAIAVNPVDTKARAPKDKVEATPRKSLLIIGGAGGVGSINAANLRNAHAMPEAGRTIGKMVLKDF